MVYPGYELSVKYGATNVSVFDKICYNNSCSKFIQTTAATLYPRLGAGCVKMGGCGSFFKYLSMATFKVNIGPESTQIREFQYA